MWIFIRENWLNLLLVIVGLSAFGVYFWQKHDQKRIAAILIKGQIDSIEENIKNLRDDYKLDNISVYNSKPILNDNMWEKYRHLFVKKFNQSEIKAIQSFFDNASNIEKARNDIISSLKNAWDHKSLVEQERIGKIIYNYPNIAQSNKLMAEFLQKYEADETVFVPNIAIRILTTNLSHFVALSNTPAYSKLLKFQGR